MFPRFLYLFLVSICGLLTTSESKASEHHLEWSKNLDPSKLQWLLDILEKNGTEQYFDNITSVEIFADSAWCITKIVLNGDDIDLETNKNCLVIEEKFKTYFGVPQTSTRTLSANERTTVETVDTTFTTDNTTPARPRSVTEPADQKEIINGSRTNKTSKFTSPSGNGDPSNEKQGSTTQPNTTPTIKTRKDIEKCLLLCESEHKPKKFPIESCVICCLISISRTTDSSNPFSQCQFSGREQQQSITVGRKIEAEGTDFSQPNRCTGVGCVISTRVLPVFTTNIPTFINSSPTPKDGDEITVEIPMETVTSTQIKTETSARPGAPTGCIRCCAIGICPVPMCNTCGEQEESGYALPGVLHETELPTIVSSSSHFSSSVSIGARLIPFVLIIFFC